LTVRSTLAASFRVDRPGERREFSGLVVEDSDPVSPGEEREWQRLELPEGAYEILWTSVEPLPEAPLRVETLRFRVPETLEITLGAP
jgi:hypothetical protein